MTRTQITQLKMTQMTELEIKTLKVVIITFFVFWKLQERLNILNRKMEDIKRPKPNFWKTKLQYLNREIVEWE